MNRKKQNNYKSTILTILIPDTCNYCERKIPNKNWFTKYGCQWCDETFHNRKDRKKSSKILLGQIIGALNKDKTKDNFIEETIKKIREILK